MWAGKWAIQVRQARDGQKSPGQLGYGTQSLTLIVDDVDAHYARSKAAGASRSLLAAERKDRSADFRKPSSRMNAQNNARKMDPLARFVLVVGASLAYFALAMLGWGSVSAFFSHPALVALAIATALLVITAYFAGGNVSSGVHEDRSNRWVVGAFALIGLLNGFFPAYTDRMGFWTLGGRPYAGWASHFTVWVALCGCGRCLCSVTDSVGLWRFSQVTRSSPGEFTA